MSKRHSSTSRLIASLGFSTLALAHAAIGCGNSERNSAGGGGDESGSSASGTSGASSGKGGDSSQGGASNGGTVSGTGPGGDGGDENGGSGGAGAAGGVGAGAGGRAGAGAGGSAGRSGAGGASAGSAGVSGGAGQNGGAGPGGGAGGGGSGGGAAGMVGVIGTACSPPGALACAGNHQKLTVLCGGDGRWQPNQTCGDGMFCDSTPGVNVGTCRPELPECAAGPGTRFCGADQKNLVTCSADLVATSSAPCDGACRNGACREVSECPVWEDYDRGMACTLECGTGTGGICRVENTGCHIAAGVTLSTGARGVIRTPWTEDWCPRCGGSFVSMTIRVGVSSGRSARMVVPEPFRILDNTTEPCDPQPRCSIGSSFEIYSPHRDVGPMNIVVEEVDSVTATCPPM